MRQQAAVVAGSADGRPDRPVRQTAQIVAQHLTVCYRKLREKTELIALRDINLEINKGEFVTIVGASGCGKTTFINVVAGIVKPAEGRVLIDGEPVVAPGADRAMVFQDYALMPWRSVAANVRFGMEFREKRLSRAQMGERVQEYIDLVGLTGFERRSRTSCRAACASGSASPGRSSRIRRSSWLTSRSRRSTR